MANLLKQLELNGFKSFAQRTTFDFSKGITAIVGPNGSGKSNIIDAIRWILGERDAKSLRGGKAEDLIFTGTPQRPRMGLAHASLHFNNSSKFFPVDYEEVTVAREVARDGTSKYFINKAEVRLKDLIDFFAQARLGTKGLIVVTQGNSDMFIRATPKERREMIEEMLGLREYQMKKSEAERKLKHTQVNLDKVRALIEEIAPHLRSLKRQTGKWERRAALAEELRMLENRVFGAEHKEIEERAGAIEREIAERSAHYAELSSAREAAELRIKEVEASEPSERKALGEIKSAMRALFEKRSELQKDLGRLEVQLEMGKTKHAPAGAPSAPELIELARDVRRRLEMLVEEEIRFDDLQEAVHEIIENIDEVISSSQSEGEEPAGDPELATVLEKLNAEVSSLEAELTSLKEKEAALEKSQEAFYTKFKEAVAELETAKDRLERWESETQQKKFERERYLLRKEEWARQVEQAGRNPDDFKNLTQEEFMAAFDHGENVEMLEKRMFRLRGDLAAIGEIDEALLKEAQETEARHTFLEKEVVDLEKAKEDLRGMITDLAERIRKEFSAALSTISDEFNTFVNIMFDGGKAKLVLAKKREEKPQTAEGEGAREEEGGGVKDAVQVDLEAETETDEGIEIELKLTRKRINSLDMLSGGERSLVGIAALFSLISVSPPPFLVLDEIDAPLDERNARRFAEMLREFAKHTQFILVTHNRATMEAAEILYGITLGDDGTSKAVSLELENAAQTAPVPLPA